MSFECRNRAGPVNGSLKNVLWGTENGAVDRPRDHVFRCPISSELFSVTTVSAETG